MKVCHIVPTSYIEVCNRNSFMHLLIAQEVLNNEKYREAYLDRSLKGDFLIMDNGAFEYGDAASLGDIIKATELVQARELVLPDCYLDGGVTTVRVINALKALMKYKLLEKFKEPIYLMAVPQGKTEKEYMKCFSEILSIDEIATIGFSYGAIGKSFEGYNLPQCLLRPMAISYLNQHFDLKNSGKDFHCLGIGGHPIEINFLKRFGFIRSVDSSKAFVCAVKGIDITKVLPAHYISPERPADYFDIQVSENIVTLALKNIKTMEKYNNEE